MALKEYDALFPIQAENLIRKHQVPLGIALCLRVEPSCTVDRREQGRRGHLVVGYSNGDLAALFRDVLGRGLVVTAHIERLIEGGQLVFPFFPKILFLPLGQALSHDLATHIEAAVAVQGVRHTHHVVNAVYRPD